MLDIQNYVSFILAIIVFQMIPGAGTITILNATARKGIGMGMSTVFGTLTGDLIYMLAAVLGLAALLSTHPNILAGAQWVGIAYLCWLGWQLLREAMAEQSADRALTKSGRAYFRRALAVSLTNPKVILFFMTFFPLFLGKNSGPMTLVTLMLHVTAISLLYQTGLVLVGNFVAQRLSKFQFVRALARRLAGAALIGLGLKLALNK